MTNQQRRQLIEVVDKENTPFFMVKNEIVTEYRQLIGSTGLDLYCFYKQMANHKNGETLYPSMTLIGNHLENIGNTTISCYNWILECCGLLKIETGDARTNNRYTLLPVNPVTPELLEDLVKALQPKATDGQRWAKFKESRLKAVKAWKPLNSQFNNLKQTTRTITPTNNDTPQTTTNELNEDELVAHLVECFKDNKPPLTETAATKMIETYGVEAVMQQLAWLEFRETDMPLRTLRAALKDKWLEPKSVGKPEPEPYWKGTHLDPALNPMPVIVESSRPKPTTPAEMWDEVAAETFGAPIVGTRLMGVEGNVWIVLCENFIQQEKLYKLNGALTKAASYTAEQEVALKFVIKEDVVVK